MSPADDAVAWGYARAADAHGVDLLQQTEVTGIRRRNGAVVGVETSRGFIGARKRGLRRGGQLGRLGGDGGAAPADRVASLASTRLRAAEARCLDTVVMSNAVHCYISQADKGDLVIGAGTDSYNGYGQRGSFHVIEHSLSAVCELFPAFSRVRMNRQWGGIVDICPDACPIIGKTPVEGLYFNCGWGTGGFKSDAGIGLRVCRYPRQRPPASARGAPFSMNRFASGALVDEHGAAGVAH